jgi:hypothetical protein
MVVDGATREPATVGRQGLGAEILLGTEVDVFTIEAQHDAEDAVAETKGALQDRVEHLAARRRATG